MSNQEGNSEFKIPREDIGDVVMMSVPGSIEAKNAAVYLEQELNALLMLFTGTAIIVDFQGSDLPMQNLARVAAICGRKAKTKKQRLYFSGLNPGTAKFLNSSGLNDVLIVCRDRSEAKRQEDELKNRVNLDVSFVNPFIEGALETLKVQCSIEAQAGSPYIYKRDETKFKPDIIALIGLTSRVFNGTVALCFKNETFLKIMSSMLGETLTEVNQEIQDGAGELLNIIFGQAKIKLNAEGHQIEKAIPSVVRGQDLNLSHNTSTVILVLPFNSQVGEFEIQVAIQRGSS